MASGNPVAHALADLKKALAKRRWYIFGAQASSIWGRPRFTSDIDVTVDLVGTDVTQLAKILRKSGFALRIDDMTIVEQLRVLPIVHRKTKIPLDLVIAGDGMERDFLNRAKDVSFGRTRAKVIAPEDLIVTKILAGRPRDLEDVEGVLVAQAKGLDFKRIRAVLAALEATIDQSDLLPLFERLLQESQK